MSEVPSSQSSAVRLAPNANPSDSRSSSGTEGGKFGTVSEVLEVFPVFVIAADGSPPGVSHAGVENVEPHPPLGEEVHAGRTDTPVRLVGPSISKLQNSGPFDIFPPSFGSAFRLHGSGTFGAPSALSVAAAAVSKLEKNEPLVDRAPPTCAIVSQLAGKQKLVDVASGSGSAASQLEKLEDVDLTTPEVGAAAVSPLDKKELVVAVSVVGAALSQLNKWELIEDLSTSAALCDSNARPTAEAARHARSSSDSARLLLLLLLLLYARRASNLLDLGLFVATLFMVTGAETFPFSVLTEDSEARIVFFVGGGCVTSSLVFP